MEGSVPYGAGGTLSGRVRWNSICYHLVWYPTEAALISIRRHIEESEYFAPRFEALLQAFLELTGALPKAVLPANPEFAGQCEAKLAEATAPLKETHPVKAIEDAGKAALQQFEDIRITNQAALEERDAALKEVIATVAEAVGSFKSHGEKHKSSFTKLADGFDALSQVEDVAELRRRLRDDVSKLRQSVEEMRRESEESAARLESQVSAFQQRVEMARKESGIDRLTGLGSRREAERRLQKASKREGSRCLLLFDIEAFGEINRVHGALFGDKVLQALAHMLRDRFPGEGVLFRWGADEFLAIAEGSLAARREQCRDICLTFAERGYVVPERGPKLPVKVQVAYGAAQCRPRENMEEMYRRSREALEQNRKGLGR